MRRFYILATLILTSTLLTTGQVNADEYTECWVNYEDGYEYDYAEIVANSEYDRICKNANGDWLGVIEITDIKYSYSMDDYGSNRENHIFVNFSRDLLELKAITVSYKTLTYCSSWMWFGDCAFDKWVYSYENTEELYNQYKDGTFLDNFSSDKIRQSYESDYEYLIITEENNELEYVDIVTLVYILTDEEVDSLNLLIQEQYDSEVKLILDNVLLTDDEKNAQLVALIEEYIDYDIDYGELITSPCVGDLCHVDNEDPFTNDTENDGLLGDIQDLVFKIGIAIVSTLGVGFIVYIGIKSALKLGWLGTLTTVKGGTKLITKSGDFWVEKIFSGTINFFSSLHHGIQSVFKRYTPVFYLGIILVIALLFI